MSSSSLDAFFDLVIRQLTDSQIKNNHPPQSEYPLTKLLLNSKLRTEQ